MQSTSKKLTVRQKWDQRYAALAAQPAREPTPFVRACLPNLPTVGRALDVAAGAGRHTVVLAKHGLRVDAIDISPQGLLLARQRCLADGVETGAVRFIVANVERGWLPHAQYDVILVSYFLYRPLFQLIKQRLRPGGWLAYETFTLDQLAQPHHHRSSNPEFYLRRLELRQAFSDFQVLFYDEADHQGRVTAQLVAQKPD